MLFIQIFYDFIRNNSRKNKISRFYYIIIFWKSKIIEPIMFLRDPYIYYELIKLYGLYKNF